jgi:hypothetical protein
MDSLIAAAARGLAAGDALGALKRVALRDDPPALALRGIAMAQLGEHARARELLRRSARAFGTREPVSRARCIVADAEVALAMRELGTPTRALEMAAAVLDAHGDTVNALQARLVATRRLLLLGRLDQAAEVLPRVDGLAIPAMLAAVFELTRAELALRTLRVGAARAALERARDAARRSCVPALVAEANEALESLERPAARRLARAGERALTVDQVAALFESDALVVDACRRALRAGSVTLPLARRPVLFALARTLAEAWPGDVDRAALIARAFRTRRPDETHRARLRVELGRLRALAAGLARIDATARGFVLQPLRAREVVLLAPPIEGEEASLLALLGDGAAWSTSALALALDTSQRTVQRALVGLEQAGRVRSIGRARAQRWLAPPLTGFTTTLLLPAAIRLD